MARTRTAARHNIVQTPAWLRAASITPPPPLPPAKKVKRFNFPYQHLADDFLQGKIQHIEMMLIELQGTNCTMSIDPNMKKEDALKSSIK